MSLKDDIAAGFRAAAGLANSWLSLGDGQRVPCLIGGEGIRVDARKINGSVTETVSATVTVLASDFGTRPQPGELGKLENGANTYDLGVAKDDEMLVEGSGNLFTFTMDN